MPRPKLRRYFRHGLFPQLMVFEAVARLESVTQAAQELHLAQPTVSTQLKKLSENLDLQLLEPRGRGVSPTPAGRELLAACGELAGLFERLDERLGALRQRTDVLGLGAEPGARHLAARLLAAFCMRYPDTQASLHVASRSELLGRLSAGEDEFCLLLAADDRPDLTMRPFAAELVHLYAPAGHALSKRRAITREVLESEPLVLREAGASLRETMLALCGKSAVRAELTSNEAVAEAVAAGLGLGLLPQGEAEALTRAGAIIRLDVQGLPLRREWKLTQAKGRRLSLLAELFLNEAVGNAVREPLPHAWPSLEHAAPGVLTQ